MSLKKTAKAAVLILFFSLLSVLSACGELNTSLFSSGETYQVRALINGNSLESCSLIRQNDKIIPYFAVSVVNDPDLIGLLVYLQNSKGDIIGDRVLYTINPVDEAVQPETKQEDSDLGDKASKGKDLENSGDNDSATSFGGTASEAGGSETTGQTEAETKQVVEKQASVDTKSVVKKYDIVIYIKSFEQEMPYFPLPKNMEIGLYSLVFEAIGTTNTLSLTESDIFYLGSAEFRLNDISVYLPGLSDTRLIPPGTTVMLEAGLDFDSRLNPYVIWYNGRSIISEGNISEGAGNILWKTPEQSGFYSLRLEVFPYRLKRNLTGIFREITLPVSAKASQIGYFFGNGPDYPAKRPLGTAYAEQVRLAADLKVNADRTATAPILPEYPELLRWYRFDGSLDEASLIPDRKFEPAGEKAPRWAAVRQSYGLSAGPDDTYLLRPILFLRQGQDQGGGIFLFHIRPVAEGTVFSAFFPLLASASDGVWMDITMRENAVTLRLKTKTASVEMPVNPGYSEEQGFKPIVVEFYIRPYRFEAKLSLGEDLSVQSMTGVIRLPGALTGEGRIKLGVDKTAPGSTAETKSASVLSGLAGAETIAASITGDRLSETVQPESINNGNTVAAVTTIWDEFAVLYSVTPLLPGEIFVRETPETEAARNEGTARNPIRTPAAIETAVSRVSLLPAESEAPLADIHAENIFMEQESTETGDEKAASLISLP